MKCLKAKNEYVEEANDLHWEQQMNMYGPTIEHWWCGCPSFAKSAYHLCKHLIRLYIGEEGLKSNKPPMPYYGQVWKQSVSPVLWISGVHSIERLHERDLRAESGPSVLLNPPTRDPWDIPPVAEHKDEHGLYYDSSDEEEDDDDGDDSDDDIEDRDNDSSATANDNGTGEDRGEDENGGFFFDDFDTGLEAAIQQDLEGEEKKENAELLRRRLLQLAEELHDFGKYPPRHPHVQEAPKMSEDNLKNLFNWAEQRKLLRNSKVLPTTFGRKRKGNVFL